MTTIRPLADRDDAEFARSFTAWIETRVETLTAEIKARDDELAQLAEMKARIGEWTRRQEATDADAT